METRAKLKAMAADGKSRAPSSLGSKVTSHGHAADRRMESEAQIQFLQLVHDCFPLAGIGECQSGLLACREGPRGKPFVDRTFDGKGAYETVVKAAQLGWSASVNAAQAMVAASAPKAGSDKEGKQVVWHGILEWTWSDARSQPNFREVQLDCLVRLGPISEPICWERRDYEGDAAVLSRAAPWAARLPVRSSPSLSALGSGGGGGGGSGDSGSDSAGGSVTSGKYPPGGKFYVVGEAFNGQDWSPDEDAFAPSALAPAAALPDRRRGRAAKPPSMPPLLDAPPRKDRDNVKFILKKVLQVERGLRVLCAKHGVEPVHVGSLVAGAMWIGRECVTGRGRLLNWFTSCFAASLPCCSALLDAGRLLLLRHDTMLDPLQARRRELALEDKIASMDAKLDTILEELRARAAPAPAPAPAPAVGTKRRRARAASVREVADEASRKDDDAGAAVDGDDDGKAAGGAGAPRARKRPRVGGR